MPPRPGEAVRRRPRRLAPRSARIATALLGAAAAASASASPWVATPASATSPGATFIRELGYQNAQCSGVPVASVLLGVAATGCVYVGGAFVSTSSCGSGGVLSLYNTSTCAASGPPMLTFPVDECAWYAEAHLWLLLRCEYVAHTLPVLVYDSSDCVGTAYEELIPLDVCTEGFTWYASPSAPDTLHANFSNIGCNGNASVPSALNYTLHTCVGTHPGSAVYDAALGAAVQGARVGLGVVLVAAAVAVSVTAALVGV